MYVQEAAPEERKPLHASLIAAACALGSAVGLAVVMAVRGGTSEGEGAAATAAAAGVVLGRAAAIKGRAGGRWVSGPTLSAAPRKACLPPLLPCCCCSLDPGRLPPAKKTLPPCPQASCCSGAGGCRSFQLSPS